MIDVIKKHEGFRLKAYQDVAGIWTIGYGNTYYEDGMPVKQGDEITKERAEQLLLNTVRNFAKGVDNLVTMNINEFQRAALVSFAYNIGLGAFRSSTLLKKVNADPNDPLIRLEFLKWNRSVGKVWKGLTNRRKEEADLYFKTIS